MNFRYFAWDERYAKGGNKKPFDVLWDLFKQLLLIAGGDVDQATKWLKDLDLRYDITKQFENGYSIDQFMEDLKNLGYLNNDENSLDFKMSKKTERILRQDALEEIFKGLKKGGSGEHKTHKIGKGFERQSETKKWQPGDDIGQIDSVGTMLNMLNHSTLDSFNLKEDDLAVYNTDHNTRVATVLLIDISHSMILYGEDRITPAKKVAMALSELILNNYTKDSLDIITFGDQAQSISIENIPYLNVGPYHTNTLQALEKARHILQRKKYANKQIFMITDGKPSCMFENGRLYKNSYGLDLKIINRVLDEAVKCRREDITITTFMIARDPYLQNFVRELTEANKGRAYFSSLNELGGYIFEDYIRNRKRNIF